MDAETFVKRVKVAVRDAAVADTVSVLQEPPSRRPSARLMLRSKWYASLPDDQKLILTEIVTDAVNSALFGMFCVLDGVRAVEDGPMKGDFQLNYVKDGVHRINSADAPFLHDLYNDPSL